MTKRASIRRQWKKVESKVAEFIGGRRVPVTGRQRGDAPDIEHNWLSVEVKHRSAIPTYLKEGMQQAVASAHPRQLPVVILAPKGAKVEDYLFCVRLGDAKEWWM